MAARATNSAGHALSQIGKRFGSVPEWAVRRLESLGAPELERIGLRLLEAGTIEELFAV